MTAPRRQLPRPLDSLRRVLALLALPPSEAYAMLTGKQVRVRYARDKIVPLYLDAADPVWIEAAERLLELFRGQEGKTRGELDDDLKEAFGNDPGQIVHQGLAKLLEDRCDMEVVSGHPPDDLRERVFLAAALRRQAATDTSPKFERDIVLKEVGAAVALGPDEVDRGLFADLKSEQRLARFKDISAERLLQRYNVALAQAVILRSTVVHATIRGEPPQRFRQLFRLAKFHRLVCEVEALPAGGFCLHLDGPLSLFSATQRYGLQLAIFLPALLHCRDFEVNADVRWGPQRKAKRFTLTAADGLVSHHADSGMFVPPELAMFADLFRRKIADWEIAEETGVLPLGEGFWVPDYRLTHKATGQGIYLEVLGFWRRSSVEKHLARLRQHATEPFLLAVSDQLRVDDAELEGLPIAVHRFRQMPLPDEVARLAGEILEAPRAPDAGA